MNWWIQSSGGDWFMRVLASRWVNLLTIFILCHYWKRMGTFRGAWRKSMAWCMSLEAMSCPKFFPVFPISWILWSECLCSSVFPPWWPDLSWSRTQQAECQWIEIFLLYLLQWWGTDCYSCSQNPWPPNSYSTPSQRKLVVYTSWNKAQGRW